MAVTMYNQMAAVLLDNLLWVLPGLPANGTIAAEVAFMFAEWYRPKAKLEFPRGGSQSIISALVRHVGLSSLFHSY